MVPPVAYEFQKQAAVWRDERTNGDHLQVSRLQLPLQRGLLCDHQLLYVRTSIHHPLLVPCRWDGLDDIVLAHLPARISFIFGSHTGRDGQGKK